MTSQTVECLEMGRGTELTEILLGHLQAVVPRLWPGIDGLTLDNVVESYCQAAAAGKVPGKDELLRRHPELAPELDALFTATGRAAPCADPTVSPLHFEHTD